MKYTINYMDVMGENFVSLVRIEDGATIPFYMLNMDFVDALKLYREDPTVIDIINAPKVAVDLLDECVAKLEDN